MRKKKWKTREKSRLGNLRIPCLEEIRELAYPHFSFTRGRVKHICKKMHLYSVDIKLAQTPNFEKKSYLDEGEKLYYVVERQLFDLVAGFSY
jgi:hypothetical protein